MEARINPGPTMGTRSTRTRLLVSVRNSLEARLALAGGADLIDVKEPNRGALGRADRGCLEEVVREVAGRVPVSAALGESVEWDECIVPEVPVGVSFAKLGLAGTAGRTDWRSRWKRVVETLPDGARAVAVVYADWNTCHAPDPFRVVEGAVELGCVAVLVDTFSKSGGCLLDYWPLEELEAFVGAVRRAGKLMVLAGALSAVTIPAVLRLGPDYIAVRGAACSGGRRGEISHERVRQLAGLLAEGNKDRFGQIA